MTTDDDHATSTTVPAARPRRSPDHKLFGRSLATVLAGARSILLTIEDTPSHSRLHLYMLIRLAPEGEVRRFAASFGANTARELARAPLCRCGRSREARPAEARRARAAAPEAARGRPSRAGVAVTERTRSDVSDARDAHASLLGSGRASSTARSSPRGSPPRRGKGEDGRPCRPRRGARRPRRCAATPSPVARARRRGGRMARRRTPELARVGLPFRLLGAHAAEAQREVRGLPRGRCTVTLRTGHAGIGRGRPSHRGPARRRAARRCARGCPR